MPTYYYFDSSAFVKHYHTEAGTEEVERLFAEPEAVGLRPGRKEVRLELEMAGPSCPIVHNYGHGGGGFTVAWGCANEVARIVQDYLS